MIYRRSGSLYMDNHNQHTRWLFYLRARGVPEDTARALLAWAFASEVINEVPVPSLRTHLARRILAQLPGAEKLDEGVVSL